MENTPHTKGKGALKWALTLGIVVVLNLFFAVAIDIVAPEPEFNNFCSEKRVSSAIEDETSCLAVGGQWNENFGLKSIDGDRPVAVSERAGFCNENYVCGMEYNEARDNYEQNVFMVLIVLGALSLGIGALLRISPAVSAGLAYGGVLTFIIASVRYWDSADDIIRLVIVALALIALIFIGVKKFKE